MHACTIEYGARLARCPERQGGKIGAWVREQGLDFVTDTNERSAALRLFNFMVDHEINFMFEHKIKQSAGCRSSLKR